MEEQKSKKNLVVGAVVGVITLVILILLVWGAMALFGNGGTKAAQAKAEKFINQELLAGQGEAKVKIVGKVNGLYKLEVEYQGQKIESYMTKDAKKFFPQAYEMAPVKEAAAADSSGNQEPSAVVTKNDKPKVELFVMSYCPYGTQIEKGIIPAIEALGNKVDFSLKFVNYAMHGEKEVQENLRQYCIAKEQNAKLLPYLKCFLKADTSAACLKSSGVDEAKMNACYQTADKQFKVTQALTDKSGWKGNYPPFAVNDADNTKYDVQGSPTLIINGTSVSSARDSASLLKAICSAFNTAPEECQKQLSTAAPSAGFGEGATTGATDASCN